MINFPEFGRFLVAGGAGFITTFVLTFFLTEYAHWWYGVSYILAALVGWVVIFTLNTLFTFRESSREGVPSRFLAFLFAYTGSFVLNFTVVIVLTEVFHVHYLISVMLGTALVILINFFVSKHILFMREKRHPLIARIATVVKNHYGAVLLALVASLVVLTPFALHWMSEDYQGIEMMMLDAENHYFARVQQVYEGDIFVRETFLPVEGEMPYATSPLGEGIVAFFGKVFGLDAARAAVLSKPISVGVIVLLIYAFAYSISRSKNAALIAAALPVFGYTLISFSTMPVIELFSGNPRGGPFVFFSRLVNPSVSGIFLFGSLFLLYRSLFKNKNISWLSTIALGTLVGMTAYVSPYTFSFLGALLFLVWIWLLVERAFHLAIRAFSAGALALVLTIPLVLNTVALRALPGYEHLAKFLGLIDGREIILGLLLPLMAAAVVFVWPKQFPREGRAFLLLACAALVLVLNQQLITGTMLQAGHYHWYITKPLAGIVAGLFVGFAIERFLPRNVRKIALIFILAVLVYNSAGFLAPWYEDVQTTVSREQRFGPLVEYLETLPAQEVVWASAEASDYIPIYTQHGAPNSVNAGSYPLPQNYFDNRLFLEYRLRGVTPEEFEEVVRREADHVSNWLWGLWLRELTGDPTAIPEEEYMHLVEGYKEFYARPYKDIFDALNITMVVTEGEFASRAVYASLEPLTTVNAFEIYRVQK